jgi:hypothetical protein
MCVTDFTRSSEEMDTVSRNSWTEQTEIAHRPAVAIMWVADTLYHNITGRARVYTGLEFHQKFGSGRGGGWTCILLTLLGELS